MITKRDNIYFQSSFIDKAGRFFPERELKPKLHLGLIKYRHRGKWLSKEQIEALCNQS